MRFNYGSELDFLDDDSDSIISKQTAHAASYLDPVYSEPRANSPDTTLPPFNIRSTVSEAICAIWPVWVAILI